MTDDLHAAPAMTPPDRAAPMDELVEKMRAAVRAVDFGAVNIADGEQVPYRVELTTSTVDKIISVALAAIQASGTHKVAPVVATATMIRAADEAPARYSDLWSAMIAAAPGVEP